MRNVLEKTADFICRWMTLWVILFSALAFLNPEPFKPIGKYISYLLGVDMLGMGLTMSLKDFRLVFTQPQGCILRRRAALLDYACSQLSGGKKR